MSTRLLQPPARTGGGSRSTTQLLDINAQLGTAMVKVHLSEVTAATVAVVTAARLGRML
jgi:hypothetical protein